MYYTIDDDFYGYETFGEAIKEAKRCKPLGMSETTVNAITCKDSDGAVQWEVTMLGNEMTDAGLEHYSDFDNMSTQDLITYLSNQIYKNESALYILLERATDEGFDIREFEYDDLQAEFAKYRRELIEDYEEEYGETCLDENGDVIEGVDIPDSLDDMETADIYECLLTYLAETYEYPNWLYECAASWLNYDLEL